MSGEWVRPNADAVDAAYEVMAEAVYRNSGKRVGDPQVLRDDLTVALAAAYPRIVVAERDRIVQAIENARRHTDGAPRQSALSLAISLVLGDAS